MLFVTFSAVVRKGGGEKAPVLCWGEGAERNADRRLFSRGLLRPVVRPRQKVCGQTCCFRFPQPKNRKKTSSARPRAPSRDRRRQSTPGGGPPQKKKRKIDRQKNSHKARRPPQRRDRARFLCFQKRAAICRVPSKLCGAALRKKKRGDRRGKKGRGGKEADRRDDARALAAAAGRRRAPPALAPRRPARARATSKAPAARCGRRRERQAEQLMCRFVGRGGEGGRRARGCSGAKGGEEGRADSRAGKRRGVALRRAAPQNSGGGGGKSGRRRRVGSMCFLGGGAGKERPFPPSPPAIATRELGSGETGEGREIKTPFSRPVRACACERANWARGKTENKLSYICPCPCARRLSPPANPRFECVMSVRACVYVPAVVFLLSRRDGRRGPIFGVRFPRRRRAALQRCAPCPLLLEPPFRSFVGVAAGLRGAARLLAPA